jgi:iron-sulfur cluster repair protein YtfE (RIC family)
MKMLTEEIELDCQWTVGQVVERYPATAAVFNHYGIDLCCGSRVSVQQAAHRDGVMAETLCAELHEAALSPREGRGA